MQPHKEPKKEQLLLIKWPDFSVDPQKPYTYWLKKNWYYHDLLKNFYRFTIPVGMRVVHVGSKDGYLLKAVRPSYGVGVDDDLASLQEAQKAYPEFQFYHGTAANIPAGSVFDYIILSSLTMEVDDVQYLFESLIRVCHPGTRVVIDVHAHWWEPALVVAQKLGLRRPTKLENWLSSHDIATFLQVAGFEVVTRGSQILMPISIPGISWLCNTIIANIPLMNSLCLNRWFIARPLPTIAHSPRDFSVSVIIPCKNERGTIQAAIERCPRMGKHTELIFVCGDSHDGTEQELASAIKKYPDRDIVVLRQDGTGKGDAVRKGFAHASGDVLMILDADLTTPPEELPKFFNALVFGKGEFINGSRLVYGMESGAMRFLNLIANTLFGIGFSWLLGQQLKDTLCGTKVLFKKDYERIAAGRAYFGEFDPFGDFDLLFGAAKLNLKIIDMPVHYKNRTYGVTQISRFRHGWLLLRMSVIGLMKFKVR